MTALMDFLLIVFIMAIVLVIQLFRKKPVKKLLLGYVVILASYIFYVSYTCGPNRSDVKAMKPMAEAIKSYVLKNGMPKSLNDIPNLPYELHQKKNGFPYFEVKNKKYEIFRKSQDMLEFHSLNGNNGNYTWLWLIFNINKNGIYTLEKEKFFAVHRYGFCAGGKQ